MHTNLSEEQPLRPGSTVRRIVNGQVVQLQVVQDQGGKIFVTDPANPKRVDQMDRKDIAPMTPEEEEEAAKENPAGGPPKLKPHGIVPDPSAAIESRPFRMDRPRRFQLVNPTNTPRSAYRTCQACGCEKPDDGNINCGTCQCKGVPVHESRLVALLEGPSPRRLAAAISDITNLKTARDSYQAAAQGSDAQAIHIAHTGMQRWAAAVRRHVKAIGKDELEAAIPEELRSHL